jgi:Xaa-Pro dipeptidase
MMLTKVSVKFLDCDPIAVVMFPSSVRFVDDIEHWVLKSLSAEVHEKHAESYAKVHTLKGLNSDSGKEVHQSFPFLHLEGGAPFDSHVLHHALSTSRVTKSEEELVVMRYAALVASNAHVAVMRCAAPGLMEFELEARFLYEIYKNGGCRRAAYTSICACGPNAAVLHYGHAGAPNDRQLLATDIALLDMGAEYHGYVSDITCSVSLIYYAATKLTM